MVLVVIGGYVLLRPAGPPPVVRGMTPDLMRVAARAAPAVAEVTVEGTPRPAVALGEGVVLTGAAPAAGTAVVDAVVGVMGVKAEGSAAVAPRIGSSAGIAVGDQLVFAAGSSAAAVGVRYVGRAAVPIGPGLEQYVMELELPAGTDAPASGPVLDREGRVVAFVTLERQHGAPAGHRYAVPIEQASDLLRDLGVALPAGP